MVAGHGGDAAILASLSEKMHGRPIHFEDDGMRAGYAREAE
jgi:hypothetical protein